MMGRGIWLLCLLVVSIKQTARAKTQLEVIQDLYNEFARQTSLATKRLWDDYNALYNNSDIIKAKQEILDDIPAYFYEQYKSYQERKGELSCFDDALNEYLILHTQYMSELSIICEEEIVEFGVDSLAEGVDRHLRQFYVETLQALECDEDNEACLNQVIYQLLDSVFSAGIEQTVEDNRTNLLLENVRYRRCLSRKVQEYMREEMNHIGALRNCA